MGVLHDIGQAVSRLVSSKDADATANAAVDKLDNIRYLNQLEDTIDTEIDALNLPALQTRLNDVIRNLSALPAAKELRSAIIGYRDALSPLARRSENKTPFGSLLAALAIAKDDIREIQDNYASLFNGLEGSKIKIGDLKTTTVVVLGYIEAQSDLVRWISYIINGLSTDAPSRVPPYQTAWLHDNGRGVANTVNEMLNRTSRDGILSIVSNMRENGADVYLETDGHTVDQYMNDNAFDPRALRMMKGFFGRGPTVMLGHIYMEWKQSRYEQLKETHELLVAKVALYKLQLDKVDDQDSEEAQRLKRIISRLSREIDVRNKEISRYEGK